MPIGSEYELAMKSTDWKTVDIPHDWLIYQAKDLYKTSTGWYRRTFDHRKKPSVRAAIRFDGVYMDSRVYVNGTLAGEWKYGYSTFEFDITDLLNDGENLIAVRVDHRSPNSRWYSGAGIYRNVWFKEYNECHIVSDGIYISSDIDGNVTVSAETERPENVPVSELSIRMAIRDGEKISAIRIYIRSYANLSAAARQLNGRKSVSASKKRNLPPIRDFSSTADTSNSTVAANITTSAHLERL